MRIIADTNVLIRSILGDDPSQSPVAKKILRDAEAIIITSPTFCEIAWTLKSHYRASRQELYRTVAGLIADAKIVCDRQAVDAGLEMLDAGGDFADGVIAFEGRRLGGTIFCSFDRKAAKLLAETGLAVDLLNTAD